MKTLAAPRSSPKFDPPTMTVHRNQFCTDESPGGPTLGPSRHGEHPFGESGGQGGLEESVEIKSDGIPGEQPDEAAVAEHDECAQKDGLEEQNGAPSNLDEVAGTDRMSSVHCAKEAAQKADFLLTGRPIRATGARAGSSGSGSACTLRSAPTKNQIPCVAATMSVPTSRLQLRRHWYAPPRS